MNSLLWSWDTVDYKGACVDLSDMEKNRQKNSHGKGSGCYEWG